MEEALLRKPARDLTPQEAFDLMIFLYEQGGIDLFDPVKSDEAGNVTSLKPGQQVKLRTTMAGVDFYKALGDNRGINGSAGATAFPYFFPTPAFAVVLYRLAVRLRDNWNVKKIVWGGIGSGSGKNEKDCHKSGHCVDFYGGTTDDGLEFDVRRDWWRRPVYGKTDGKAHATKFDLDDRWADDTKTYFRLASSSQPQDHVPWRFFADVYQLVTEECTLAADISGDEFRRGSDLKAGTVFHPDYPIAGVDRVVAGRRGHNDHMHFQLGGAFE